jgi:hypothetical protein
MCMSRNAGNAQMQMLNQQMKKQINPDEGEETKTKKKQRKHSQHNETTK